MKLFHSACEVPREQEFGSQAGSGRAMEPQQRNGIGSSGEGQVTTALILHAAIRPNTGTGSDP